LKEYIFYDLSDEIYEKLFTVTSEILKNAGIVEKDEVFFELFAEIVQNAAKANFKEVIRREMQLDMNKEKEYELLMNDFKNRLPKAHIELANKAKDHNLYVMFRVYLNEAKILHLQVVNNRPASFAEMKRLDFKIEEAKKYEKLADFYLINYDDTEGAGLGTALIIISLRSMGYHDFLYRVYNDDMSRTVAELVVDLKESRLE